MTRCRSILIQAVVAACLLAPLSSTGQTPEAHHAAAGQFMEAGRWAEALGQLRQALRLDRNHLPSLLRMADLLSSQGGTFEAYGVLKHTLEIAPQSAEAHSLLGRSWMQMRKTGKAGREFQRALELDSGLREPHLALSILESDRGRYVVARRHIGVFLETATGPARVQALEHLARIGLAMKSFDVALEAYRELLEINPDRNGLRLAVATVLSDTGRYAESEATYRTLVEEEPGNQVYWQGLFAASYERGAYVPALEAAERLIEFDKWSCQPLMEMVRVHRRLNQFEQARAVVERCFRLIPTHAGAHYLMGRLWDREGKLSLARKEWELSLRADGRNPETLYWLGTAEFRAGDNDQALKHLERAATLDADHAPTRYTLARLYAALGRRADARHQQDEFRRLKRRQDWGPQNGQHGGSSMAASPGLDAGASLADYISFATYLIGEEKPRDALRLLEVARALAPEDGPERGEVLRLVAVAHSEMGEIDEALAAYAKAEQHAPIGFLYLGRGTIYFRLEENERSLAELQKAVALDLPPAKVVEAHLLVAALLNRLERQEEAEAALRRALAVDSGNPSALSLLGSTLLELGKPEEAAVESRRALEVEAEHGPSLLTLARALLAQGKTPESSRALERAGRSLGETAEVLRARADLAVQQGLQTSAVDYLTQATRTDPSQAELFYRLGKLHLLMQTGRNGLQAATLALEKAVIVEPGHAASWLELGKIYLTANQTGRAVSSLQNAARFAPRDAEANYHLALALGRAGKTPEAMEAARSAQRLGHPDAAALLNSLSTSNPR